MTWLNGLLLIGASLALVVVGLVALGKQRWAASTRDLKARLEAGCLPVAQGRYDPRELDGLPAPVQRYFRAVLKDGQPFIAAATIQLAGTINLSATGQAWKRFTSTQRVVTRRPGFLWDAQVAMAPGVPVRVVDSYIAGEGHLRAAALGLFTVAEAHGGGEIARGELMRWLGEAAWVPTALLPSQGVSWQAVDGVSASATIVEGPFTLTLLFGFDGAGLIVSVRAAARGAGVGKDMVMLPWECTLSDYRPQDGMLLPMAGEAAWLRPEGRKAYFIGGVVSMRHEFVP
jgi:hypothetical protein